MTKVLLIEDNEMNRDMLGRRLVRSGFEVCTAADGLSGITAAKREHPNVILMDIGLGLGEMDGWEAARQIKADVATAAIPIIALTAHATTEDRARSFEAGCEAFDTKPVDFDRLLSKISDVLVKA
ncbi:response regulator [Rhodospirillaceae bacterium SYSU D60014]|uniref:response regulator n=1 Tax=Virgifigura deserti TaxID=2268457 RepID=UPI000E6647FF